MGELGLYEGLATGVSITVTLIDWDISQDKRSCLPCMRAQLPGERWERNPSKTYTPAGTYAQTHLQVVSLLAFTSQPQKHRCSCSCISWDLLWPLTLNWCILFSFSFIFFSLWSHHLLHYRADRTLKFDSRDSTVFMCLARDSAVLMLLIINQGSVFLKIPSGCLSITKV